MTVALFGGRFDPIHNGHMAVAKEILKVKAADEVWLSIENQHQWRPIVASWQDRKNMAELAIEEESSQLLVHSSQKEIAMRAFGKARNDDDDSLAGKFKIDLTPIELGGLTETLTVIRTLRQKYPYDFLFVVGSDQIPTFPQWTHWRQLQKEVTFLMVARKGFPITDIPKNCIVIDDPNYIPLDDSATQIRERVKNGQSISALVPKKVEEYIISHGLYKGKG